MERLESRLGLTQLLPNSCQIEPGARHLGLEPYRLIKLQGCFAKKGFGLIFHRRPRSDGLIGEVEKTNPPMKMFFIGIICRFRDL